MKRLLFSLFLLLAIPCFGVTTYYVSNVRTSNGTGTLASPWKLLSNISWSAVNTSLASGDVIIYVDSRQTNSEAGTFNIARTDTSTNFLKVIGNEFYCTGATGTAAWTAESSPYVAQSGGTIVNSGNLAIVDTQNSGSGIYIETGLSYIRLQGLYSLNAAFGGINMGANVNPTINLTHIEIVGCKVTSPTTNHGIWFGYAETGCHDWLVSGNYVYGTQAESIYLGHFSYLTNSITNVIVENNVVVDCGLSGQGDIDVKPACYGAIIRGNIHYRSSTAITGTSCGVVVASNNCQIYGNKFYMQAQGSDWGWGIFINSEGDGMGTGKGITSCLVYNNLIYANDNSGIAFFATTSTVGADISGVKIWNNTIWTNLGSGIYASATTRTITIAELYNNIIGSDAGPEIDFNNSTITASDYNLLYRTSGTLVNYGGSNRTWAQWQGLGYDSHGLNVDPLLTNVGSSIYTLQSGSTAKAAASDLSAFFTTDITGATRPTGAGTWSMGAYQYFAAGGTGGSSLSGKTVLLGNAKLN